MKYQILLLWITLILGTVISKKTDYAYTTGDLIYNLKCLEDNRGICKFLEKELFEAATSISKIINFEKPAKFEAFVDDLSKYRITTSREVVAVVLDKEFVPLNTTYNNIISPYPNSEVILKNVNNKDDNDFYVVLNNFKSNKNYLSYLHEDFDSSMIMEIFEELKTLGLIGYPYNGSLNPQPEDFYFKLYLPKREELDRIEFTAANATRFCHHLVDGQLVRKIVHWDDTLISKETVASNNENSVVPKEKINKFSVKKNNNNKDNSAKRIVAVGDIHGDYDHLVTILRHAKLIDKKNNWIGKDSILVQLGDLNERGNDTLKAYDILIDLREQAKVKGGSVYVLIGNHEIFSMQGNHFYTSLKEYESFGGLEGLEKAFSPEGKVGKFIRQEMNATMVIGDLLFTHSGVFPEFVTEGAEKFNEYTRQILLDTPSVDELYQLSLQNITHPIYSDPVFSQGLDGPLNTKFFSNYPENEVCPILEEVLKLTNTKKMIVGHVVQSYGKIKSRCDNKLILTDVGISRCIDGGYYGYLEILNDKKEIWARYINQNN